MYRFANRVRKLDEEEIQFYDKVEMDTIQKAKMISKMEKQELEKFRNDAEMVRVASIVEEKRVEAKGVKRRDEQSEILKGAVVRKRTKANADVSSTVEPKSDIEAFTLEPKSDIKESTIKHGSPIQAPNHSNSKQSLNNNGIPLKSKPLNEKKAPIIVAYPSSSSDND